MKSYDFYKLKFIKNTVKIKNFKCGLKQIGLPNLPQDVILLKSILMKTSLL